MNERRVVITKRTQAAPRQRIIEIPWSRPGVVPIISDESPLVVPSQNLIVIGFTVTLGVIDAASEINAYLVKNSDRAGGGETVAHVRINAGSGMNYAYQQVAPAVSFIGRKDWYSVLVNQVGGTAAAELGGTIEIAEL
jgi:hypothetical protein